MVRIAARRPRPWLCCRSATRWLNAPVAAMAGSAGQRHHGLRQLLLPPRDGRRRARSRSNGRSPAIAHLRPLRAFIATAPQHRRPTLQTGIGSWHATPRSSGALVRRNASPRAQTPSRRVRGRAVMPATNFYEATAAATISTHIVPKPICGPLEAGTGILTRAGDPADTKAPVHRDPYPDAERRIRQPRGLARSRPGVAPYCWPPSAIAWSATRAWSRGVSDFKTGLGRGGRAFRGRARVRAAMPPGEASPPTSRRIRLAGIGGRTDAEIIARCHRKASAATDGRSSRRWPSGYLCGA